MLDFSSLAITGYVSRIANRIGLALPIVSAIIVIAVVFLIDAGFAHHGVPQGQIEAPG
jgi:hypothetical protein